MSLHGLGVIGAQVAASIKSSDEKRSPKIAHPSSLPPSPHEATRSFEFDPSIGAKPHSPFYSHAAATVSYEELTFTTKTADHDGCELRDLENAGPYKPSRTGSPRRSKLWDKQENPPRSCFHRLSHRQRMIIKAIIAVGTVGTMIAIALGITAAVGGATWRDGASKASLGG
ncbi:hypothetical protein N7495_006757 [Penicillium taxi]|uniref:uncharacterized protein n=1 Tax=Penicillium taxi TaxID=168475 RepID=UPI002544FEB5|nr:uncharacterized protein N7495_006757 [Penicillium taxi]KAJ5895066.1 hypothetical protein N7495_006757 [Penicillium taxi]